MNTSPTIQRASQEDAKPRLLRMNEVAERLGVSVQRAYELGRCGLLPTVRLGRQMRVAETRLAEWIDSGGQALPGGWRRQAG